MFPLRLMQSTGPQWTVKLEDVTLYILTEVGGADGTENNGYMIIEV